MTHTLNLSLLTNGGSVSQAISVTADAEVTLVDHAVTIGTDVLVNVAFPYALIKSVILLSTVNLTIETNSSSSPADTIILTAGIPNIFVTGYGTNPFSADVTKIYRTSAAVGVLNVRVLYDPTP